AGRRRDPPRRPRLLLRLGGAARRPTAAGSAGDRGSRCGPRRQLRGQGVRHPDRHDRWPGPPAVPVGRGRPPQDVGVHRGQPGGVRGLRRYDAAGRGAVHRRGLPRRGRPAAAEGEAQRDRRQAAEAGAGSGGAADHGRGGPDQVPGQGGQRRRQARRSAGGAGRRRARVPPPPAGRAALGRRTGDRRQAPRPRAQHRRRGGPDGRGRPRGDAGAGRWPPHPRLGAQPRPEAGGGRPPTSVHRIAVRPRPQTEDDGQHRCHSGQPGRPGHPPAPVGAADRPHRRAAPAVRRPVPRHPLAHAPRGHRADGHDPRRRPRVAHLRASPHPGAGDHLGRGGRHQHRRRSPRPAGAAVRPPERHRPRLRPRRHPRPLRDGRRLPGRAPRPGPGAHRAPAARL
ncbi:MAG: DNA polymerase IV, partial [uncultured Acidimicrobiales bacterium]